MQRFTLNALRGLAALALVHGAATAQAAGYPAKSIVFIVPYTEGGAADLVVRTAGAKVAEKLGQPVIVEIPSDQRPRSNTCSRCSASASRRMKSRTKSSAGWWCRL